MARLLYGIRVRRSVRDPWQQVRTYSHPHGRWSMRFTAQKTLDSLKKRGYAGHIFAVKQRVKYPNKSHYSPNFSMRELHCKCGCKTPAAIQANLARLAQNLEKMRTLLGAPIKVISGYRCPAHNRRVGGASQSQHMRGTAADISGASQAKLKAAAMRVPAFNNGGIGVYPNGGFHVDIRGYKARWDDWNR